MAEISKFFNDLKVKRLKQGKCQLLTSRNKKVVQGFVIQNVISNYDDTSSSSENKAMERITDSPPALEEHENVRIKNEPVDTETTIKIEPQEMMNIEVQPEIHIKTEPEDSMDAEDGFITVVPHTTSKAAAVQFRNETGLLKRSFAMTCKICHTSFLTSDLLAKHYRRCRPRAMYRKGINKKYPFHCELCIKTFASLAALSLHVQNEHVGESHKFVFSYKCKHCILSFPSLATVKWHEKDAHLTSADDFKFEDHFFVLKNPVRRTFHAHPHRQCTSKNEAVDEGAIQTSTS